MRVTGSPAFIIPALFFLVTAIQSCSKDELTTSAGFIINTGSFSSGGCEWIIVTGSDRFQPDNLPDAFKQPAVDSLPVEITYRVVDRTANCPLPQNYSGLIHLNRIKLIQ